MRLDWNEWECPYCHRIGQTKLMLTPEQGDKWKQQCPNCKRTVLVACEYLPQLFAARHGDAE